MERLLRNRTTLLAPQRPLAAHENDLVVQFHGAPAAADRGRSIALDRALAAVTLLAIAASAGALVLSIVAGPLA